MDVVMRMPDVATVDDTVTLVRWLVETGQSVRRGEPLLEVETDKAILVIESAISGLLHGISVNAGAEVARGQAIATFRVEEGRTMGSTPPPVGPSAGVPDDRGGPIAGAAGVVSGTADLAAVEAPEIGELGGRRSFFARNREARAQTAATGTPVVEPSSYDPAFLMDLYRRMVLIREFEDGVKFLFLEGSMPGTIHQCQGQEATAVGVCAAHRGG